MSRKKFIRLGAAVGLGSAAVPLVGACGGEGGSAGSGETPTASGTAGGGEPKVRKGEAIAKESEVGSGSAFPFTDAETGQQSVLVHLENGGFAAYSAACTHQACTVAYQPQTQELALPLPRVGLRPGEWRAADNRTGAVAPSRGGDPGRRQGGGPSVGPHLLLGSSVALLAGARWGNGSRAFARFFGC